MIPLRLILLISLETLPPKNEAVQVAPSRPPSGLSIYRAIEDVP